MEPEGSLLHSQASATCAYPKPDQSSPLHLTSWRSFLILSSNLRLSSEWYRCICSPDKIPVSTYPVPHTCHIPRPSHSSLIDHPNNRPIFCGVQIIKFPAILSTPILCQVAPLTSKYSIQHPILEHHQPMFLTQLRGQVTQLIAATDKIIVLFNLMVTFFG